MTKASLRERLKAILVDDGADGSDWAIDAIMTAFGKEMGTPKLGHICADGGHGYDDGDCECFCHK